jgi:hypothetical protein
MLMDNIDLHTGAQQRLERRVLSGRLDASHAAIGKSRRRGPNRKPNAAIRRSATYCAGRLSRRSCVPRDERRFAQLRRVGPHPAARDLFRADRRTAWPHARANGRDIARPDSACQRYHDLECDADRRGPNANPGHLSRSSHHAHRPQRARAYQHQGRHQERNIKTSVVWNINHLRELRLSYMNDFNQLLSATFCTAVTRAPCWHHGCAAV